MADDLSAMLGFEPDLEASLHELEQEAKKEARSHGKHVKDVLEEEPVEVMPFYQVTQGGPNAFHEAPPEAFVPPEGFLKHDAQDALLPRNSFISDFVYSLKGYESPVLFNIWGAVYTLAVMAGRQTWFKFGSGEIFPNMYIIWVAKPGVCKKSTSLGLATHLLQKLPDQFPDDAYMREDHSVPYISSKASADAVLMALAPKNRTFIGPDGTLYPVDFGSRSYVSAMELATFLNTKKFNTGLVDTLTSLYDCLPNDNEITRIRGIEEYKNIYFNLGGACTPMHMETSFPPEARGGGLMSRCIIVHQEFPSVWHSIPQVYEGFPVKDDLLRSLRWIAYTSRGEYNLTDEAFKEYDRWYMQWRNSLFERGVQDDALAETRQDILTLKLATLIRMAEYRPGHDITLENYEAARKLLTYTIAYSNAVAGSLGSKEKRQSYTKIRKWMQKKGHMTRRQLIMYCSSKSIFAQEVNVVVGQLVQEGYIEIKLNGFTRPVPGTEGREEYTWTGPTADQEDARTQVEVAGGDVDA